MFLFTRISTIAPGRMRSAQGFIADVTAHVNENTPFDVSVWAAVFGRPVGTVAWSLTVDSLAEFLDASGELNASSAYVDKVNSSGDVFAGPAEDFLREVVHVAGEPPTEFDYATSTVAVVAERFTQTIGWSIEMTDLAHATTGHAAMLLRDVYGDFGGLMWLSGVSGAAAIEAANAAIRDSPDYLAKLDEAAGMFIPGSARQGLLRRLM
jgi:hypothetical protein